MLISSEFSLFSISVKGFSLCGYYLRKIGSFRLLARRLLISEISAPQFASFFTKYAHYHDYHSHLTGFCSFDCNFISLHSFIESCIGNFNWTGLMRLLEGEYPSATSCPSNLTWVSFQQVCPKAFWATSKYSVAIKQSFYFISKSNCKIMICKPREIIAQT